MGKTTGYFFAGSKCGGVSSQYCMFAPAAPVTVELVGFGMSVAASHAAFSLVSCRVDPSADTRYRSVGATSDDLAKMANPCPGCTALTAPPRATRVGAPPLIATV